MTYTIPENQIINIDCVKGMKTLPNDIIPLTVTSPPYDDLRSYDGLAQWDFMDVANELYRITMPGGVVVWVVQEQIVNGSESGETSRQRLAFANIGFRLHHTMVMARHGSRHYPSNRYGAPLEYAFVLSKGKPRYVCLLRDKPNTGAGITRKDQYQHRLPDGSVRRNGKRPKTPPFGIRPGVWYYATGGNVAEEKYAFEHPSLMPEKMAEDHILSWSKVGDLIFNPFAGSGTVPKMAMLNYRRYLGYEINPKYVEIAQRRLKEAEATMELRTRKVSQSCSSN